MPTAAERLARWSARLSYERIPARVRHVARRCIIDTLAVMLAGARMPVAARARRVAVATSAPGRAQVFGHRLMLAAPGAAFANGVAAHALDFDDNCYAGFVHGSAVIVPAVLAVAQARGLSGRDLITAFVAGCEAEFAIGAAATATIYERGWWTTGALGPIGAAVAASHALGLDARATGHAIGLAVGGTGGLKAIFGTDAKPTLCGRAAEAGVVAALLAAEGTSGPAAVFEDPRGFARLFNADVFDSAALDRLGKRWYLLDPGIDIKRIPVCLSAHAAVDAASEIVAAHALALDDIARIRCAVGPIVAANLVYGVPTSVQQAQFSLPFAIACALVHGDITLAHLERAVVADRRLQSVMARVDMQVDRRWTGDAAFAAAAPEGAEVTIETRDGRRLTQFNPMARGTTARPLPDDALDAKFLACAKGVLPAQRAQALLARLRALDDVGAVRGLVPARR